jgi:hypothetical protein
MMPPSTRQSKLKHTVLILELAVFFLRGDVKLTEKWKNRVHELNSTRGNLKRERSTYVYTINPTP